MAMSWLPRVLRWVFWIFTILMGIAAFAIVVTLIVDPKLPAHATMGPANVELFGQPGFLLLKNSTLMAQYIAHNGVNVRIDNAGALFEVIKHTGLPVGLVTVLYFGFLFELLRRLFRNVERGQSFTRQTVGLVQIIGFSLLVFSVVSAAAEGWFQYVLFDYLAHHAQLSISGSAIRLPAPGEFHFETGSNSLLGNSYFFTGLLVLALSEVFRQGLTLKTDSDLTI